MKEQIEEYLTTKLKPENKIDCIAWLLLNVFGCKFCKVCRDKPCNIKDGETCTDNIANYIREVVKEEAGYRKQSENVIELPCAIDTTIYELCFEKEDPCSWCEHDHSGFGDYICDFDYDPYPEVKDLLIGEAICPKNEMKVTEIKFNLCFYHYNKDWFNITWFLTKEEAEQALAKMKGGAE